jgi:hypothetical protein
MVTLASAILVEKMTFRVSRGGGSKMMACSSTGRVAYSGSARILGAAFGNLRKLISDGFYLGDLLDHLIYFLATRQEDQDISRWLLPT